MRFGCLPLSTLTARARAAQPGYTGRIARMKQEPSFFEGKEPVLIYIAKKLRDALRLESVFTAAGVDYGVEADEYRGGVADRAASWEPVSGKTDGSVIAMDLESVRDTAFRKVHPRGVRRFGASCAGARLTGPPGEDRRRSKPRPSCPATDCRTWRAFDRGSLCSNGRRATGI